MHRAFKGAVAGVATWCRWVVLYALTQTAYGMTVLTPAVVGDASAASVSVDPASLLHQTLAGFSPSLRRLLPPSSASPGSAAGHITCFTGPVPVSPSCTAWLSGSGRATLLGDSFSAVPPASPQVATSDVICGGLYCSLPMSLVVLLYSSLQMSPVVVRTASSPHLS